MLLWVERLALRLSGPPEGLNHLITIMGLNAKRSNVKVLVYLYEKAGRFDGDRLRRDTRRELKRWALISRSVRRIRG